MKSTSGINVPRFVYEYAKHTERGLIKNELMQESIREESLQTIRRAVGMCERGYITINEAMHIISNQ